MELDDTAIPRWGLGALVLACAFLLVCLTGCAAVGQSSGESQQTSNQTAPRQAGANEVVGIIGAMDAEVDSLKAAAGAQSVINVRSNLAMQLVPRECYHGARR